MKKYRLEISATAEKQLRRIGASDQRRLVTAIRQLAIEPRPHGSRKLRGHDDTYRIRVGNFRLIYSVDDEVLAVIVFKRGKRRDIYR